MKVYILQAHIEYEGFNIIGVFTDFDDAQAMKFKLEKENDWVDWYDITAHELEGEMD